MVKPSMPRRRRSNQSIIRRWAGLAVERSPNPAIVAFSRRSSASSAKACSPISLGQPDAASAGVMRPVLFPAEAELTVAELKTGAATSPVVCFPMLPPNAIAHQSLY